MEKQTTIARDISLSGVGLHSGKKVSLTLRPAPADSGVVFFRADLPGKPAVKASHENVRPKTSSMRYSYIENEHARVVTVEHLLAALLGMGIDNVYAETDAEELPGFDGSSREYVQALAKAGVQEQEAARRYFAIREPVHIEENGAYIIVRH